MNQRIYKIDYAAGEDGCPHHLSEKQNPDEWEWGSYETNPFDVVITKKYATKIVDGEIKNIDFDYYGTDSPYVSNLFVGLCEDLSINFRAIPIDITLKNGKHPSKSYFVFLPGDHLAILDPEKSKVEIDADKETGEPITNSAFPQIPIYNKISKFVLKNIATPHLFHCIEIFSLVCTEVFRNEIEKRNLRGLQFTLLDANYTYDPWADW